MLNRHSHRPRKEGASPCLHGDAPCAYTSRKDNNVAESIPKLTTWLQSRSGTSCAGRRSLCTAGVRLPRALASPSSCADPCHSPVRARCRGRCSLEGTMEDRPRRCLGWQTLVYLLI